MGYKAVFITVGAHQSLRMGIEGEESPGVIDGATFLREVNLGLKPSLGEEVAVVGGGMWLWTPPALPFDWGRAK